MTRKNILFIGAASGLGDRIAIIPKLLALKEQGYHISLLIYEPAYFTLFYNVDEILEIYKDNNLYDELLFIPRNKFKLVKFILKNIKKFNESYTPVNTFFSGLLGKIFSKKYTYAFKNMKDKDNGEYNNIIEASLKNKSAPLFEYKKTLQLHLDDSYREKFGIQTEKFITLFVSLYVRCMPIEEIKKIMKFLGEQGFTIILIGGNREKRINEFITTKEYPMINLLGKTKILEVASILSDSILNISMDGGLMWLGHLMNKNNISIQNTSVSIMQAPVDNIHSFNLREYTYPSCTPCSHYGEPQKGEKHRIKKCVFYGTEREGECRYATKGENVIYLIKKILNKQQ